MRKVIDIGETILDIIFRGNQPLVAVPGGPAFNGIVSLECMGINVCPASKMGSDHVGNIILQFMRDNHISTDYINVSPDGRSPVSLASLDEHSDVECAFYEDYPGQRLDILFPPINGNNIIVIGSYHALNSVLHNKTLELLGITREKKMTVYYDPNFCSLYKNEAMKLVPIIIENLEYAGTVRGSLEDFYCMYGVKDTEKIYKDRVEFYCPLLLCTVGVEKVPLHINTISKKYPATPSQAISIIGAGDNFNAGLIYGMLKYDTRCHGLQNLSEETWDKVVQYGQNFSAEVCKSFGDSASEKFAANYR